MKNETPQPNDILFYSTPAGEVKIEVIFNNETFWPTQKRMGELFGVESHTITYHPKRNLQNRGIGRDGNYSKNSGSSKRRQPGSKS